MIGSFDVSELGAAVGEYTGDKIAAEVSSSLDKGQDMATGAVNGVVQ